MNVKGSIVKTRLLMYFIGLILLSPPLYIVMSFVIFGIADSQRLSKFAFPGHVIVMIVIFILYYMNLSVLRREISSDDEIAAKRINQIPFRGALFLGICVFCAPLFTMTAAVWLKIVVSVYQSIYYIMIGLMLSIMVALVFYYKSKVLIYKLRSVVKISPLSLFHKILIPIMCTIMITFYLASSGLYYQNSHSIFSMYSKEIAAKVESNSNYIASFFGSVQDQLMTLSHSEYVINGKKDEIKPMLERMASTKSKYVQSFMYAGLDGNMIDNVDTKIYAKGRSYFDKTILTGKPFISDPIVSKRDGKTIVVMAYPVKRGNETVGIVASAIIIDELRPIMQRDTIMSSGRYIVITKEGKVFYHNDSKYVGQTIGNEIKDDGKNTLGLTKIVSEPAKTFYEYTFGGLETVSYKVEIPGIERWLIFSFEKRDLCPAFKKLNKMS